MSQQAGTQQAQTRQDQSPQAVSQQALGPNGQSVGQLVAAASKDMSTLIRAEIDLAKAELREDAKHAALSGGLFGAAAYVASLAVVLLSFAAAYGLVAAGLHEAWAFLIVGGAWLLLGMLFALVGRGRAKRIGPPTRTIRTVKDNVAFVRQIRQRD